MDRVLHAERVERGREKRTYEAPLSSLPGGTMVELGGCPHLLWNGELRPWSFSGYGPPAKASQAASVRVLTPRSIVRALDAGFVPQIHGSASDGG